MQKLQGIASLGGKQIVTSGTDSFTESVESFPNCLVTVYISGTTNLASIFSDNAGTAKANPFTSSSADASWSFYASSGHYDVKFSGGEIDTPFTLGDMRIQETEVFNVLFYGWLPDGTDHSTEALALLTLVSSLGGGTIYFPPSSGTYRADSQLFIPNDSATPQPNQVNIRFTGAGGGGAWYGVDAAVLDLRYHASNGNAKIESRGLGTLEFDHLTLKDGGSVDNTPLMHFTNTTPIIHNNTFIGSTVYQAVMPGGWTRSTQDAIVLGGATNNIDGSVTATYQGYAPRIYDNHFRQLNRGVYLRWNANAANVTGNSFQGCTGKTAIESSGAPAANVGNYGLNITGNNIEMNVYQHGITLTNTNGSTFSNSFYDNAPSVANDNGYAGYNLISNAKGNTFYHVASGEAPIGMLPMFIGETASLTTVTSIGGIPPPAAPTDARTKDVFAKGNTNAEFGNNLVVRGEFNTADVNGYPGQLTVASASSPGKALRLGYNFVNGNNAFIEATDGVGSGKPLLLNNTEAINGNGSAPVGVGNIPYTALAAPLHVGVNSSGIAQQWGDTTNTNWARLDVTGVLTNLRTAGNRPLTFTVNGNDGVSISSSGAATVPISLGIGGGTTLTKILKGAVTIDPASINATTVSSQTFTLTGAVVGDSLVLNPPAAGLTAGLVIGQYFVSAANTITIVLYNTTGAPIDEASASWIYKLVRS